MKWYRADLHIHTVLSPCGDLTMSPARIIFEAKNKNLDIIGVTDHNSTLHARLMVELGQKYGITVIPGVEVNTSEEVHCLAFFENTDNTEMFQNYISEHLNHVDNQPDKFGMQLVVNEKEEILDEVRPLLIASINAGIDEVEKKVHELGGIFIPAHVNRQMNGIYSQIGFLPGYLSFDAVEITGNQSCSDIVDLYPELGFYTVIKNSDAHYPECIGSAFTEYLLEKPTFTEWVKAVHKKDGREVRVS